MKHYKLNVGLSFFAISGLLLFAVTPVLFALSSSSSSSRDVIDTTVPKVENVTVNEHAVKVDSQHLEDRINQSRAAGSEKLAELRAGKTEKTAAQRLKICDARKTSIQNKLSAYNNQADQKLTRFDTIFARVKAIKTEKQLQVVNYDALLVAPATQKKTVATESVAALEALTADFNCNKTDPAATIAAIKSATSNTRTALKEYRQAIKDIVVAIAQVNKTSKASDNTNTTTGVN